MKQIKPIIWGVAIIALGLIFGLNALGLFNIDIFFDGWWTLFIIVPSVISLFTEKDKLASLGFLAAGIILLLAAQDVFSYDVAWKVILAVLLVIAGLGLIIKSTFRNQNDKEVENMARVYNFSAGPSCLPEDVLKECAAEMLDYQGSGQSVMEMSHRSKNYEPIIQDAEAMVRKLMNVPDNYKVLFVQGGGSTQFAMVAQNLGIKNKKAAYIETGVWAKKAAAEAKHLGIDVDIIASSKDKNYSYIPKVEKITGDYDYAYICFNNMFKWQKI